MNIPIDAHVKCADGECGRSKRVVINPATQQVTHLVVDAEGGAGERLVPIDRVMETQPDQGEIRLTCTGQELQQMDPFAVTQYMTGDTPYATYSPGAYVLWPYMTPVAGVVPLEHERIPPGELAVRRGAEVRATDGDVGKVDAFLVDPTDSRISHLVLREGPFWNRKLVSVPVANIQRIEEGKVYLSLDKKAIEELPDIPVLK